MRWYHYLAYFFAGAFLCNAIPHVVSGLRGDAFPTPFARPPGRGLSSPVVNFLWGFLNLIISLALLSVARIQLGLYTPLILFLLGFLLLGLMLLWLSRRPKNAQPLSIPA